MRVASGTKWTRRAHITVWVCLYLFSAFASLVSTGSSLNPDTGAIFGAAFMTGLSFGMAIYSALSPTDAEFEEEAERRGFVRSR